MPTPVYKVTVTVPDPGVLDRLTGWTKGLADFVGAVESLVVAVIALLGAFGFAWAKKRKDKS